LQGADLGLLDRLLFAAQLHRGIHLDAEAATGRLFEFLAHVFDRNHGGIACRMNVGGLEHHFLLRCGRSTGERARNGQDRGSEDGGEGLHVGGPPSL
jgi:hypothetical protein